jgi:hypothetical protein
VVSVWIKYLYIEYTMSTADLKKQLKELRPKFTSTEEEIAYHTAAKKSLAAKERMAAVRAAKKGNTPAAPASAAPAAPAAPTEKAPKAPKVKKVKEEVKKEEIEVVSAKKKALLAQLAALGSV